MIRELEIYGIFVAFNWKGFMSSHWELLVFILFFGVFSTNLQHYTVKNEPGNPGYICGALHSLSIEGVNHIYRHGI